MAVKHKQRTLRSAITRANKAITIMYDYLQHNTDPINATTYSKIQSDITWSSTLYGDIVTGLKALPAPP